VTRRATLRLLDIKERIVGIRALLADQSIEQLRADPFRLAAFERYLEIISEASRYVPDAWKMESETGVPWQKVAGLGNVLRHVYQNANLDVLWSIYENDLDPLEASIDAMIALHPDMGD
jgi:uncharacterized protein with HEPN domain